MIWLIGLRRSFDDPITVDGSKLVTLRDGGYYIAGLPKAVHDLPEWQAAMEALIVVAEQGGPTTSARIGVMRALNRDRPNLSRPRGESAPRPIG